MALGTAIVPSAYSHQGVQFEIPDLWKVVEDDPDEMIRAITLDTPSEGSCMIDLYKREQAPSLDRYVDNQIKHFGEALPFGYKIVKGPSKSVGRALRREQEVLGTTVRLQIRTLLMRRFDDFNCFYSIELEHHTAMISLRCPEDALPELRPGLLRLLESFNME